MDKFAPKVKPGGLLLYESGNIFKISEKTDIEIIGIPATTEAISMKNAKIMNMIMLGGYLGIKQVVKNDTILEALQKVLPEKYHHLLLINKQALEKGAEMVASLKETPVM